MKKLIRRGLFTSILIIIGEILCFSMILGCSNKNPLDSDNNQADTDKLNEAGFPLAVGNHWVYRLQGEMTTISPDTTITSWDVEE